MIRAGVWLVLLVVGCGRLGFESRLGADDAPADVRSSDSVVTGAPTYVKPFAERHPGAGNMDSFSVQATAAGDTIVVQVACKSVPAPGSVSVNAPGWGFASLGSASEPTNSLFAYLFVTAAPNTDPVTMTVAWGTPAACSGTSVLGDEWANAVVVAQDNHGGTGNCTGTVTTVAANNAIWSACFSSSFVSAIGPGYTKGADNAGGDWTEYKRTNDPPGTVETATFTSTATYISSTLALGPQ